MNCYENEYNDNRTHRIQGPVQGPFEEEQKMSASILIHFVTIRNIQSYSINYINQGTDRLKKEKNMFLAM